ncbi:meiosis-specific protein MEI4 [Hemicordylus capensis]|uniref:meiosis-specific protein MEI4 n=1 Tax=Hemicordylus capensis TaxID=884348 RepID=UPI0023030342|nr:meiosis-specific protein MEI4 [Hemicordylus capensis]
MESLESFPMELSSLAADGTDVLAFPCGRRAEIKNREDVMWYLKTSQLALALAIIRSKPLNQSSKGYTEHLAKIISGQDSKWKSRVDALEAEVLHLKQQLLLSKISSGLSLENRIPVVIGKTLLINTEDCSGHLEDSGCDVSNDFIGDTLEILSTSSHSKGDCNCSAPHVNPLGETILTPCADKRISLVAHMRFLQCFLELKNVTEARGLRADVKKLGNDCSTISDSVFLLLDGLVTLCSLPELPFSDVMTRGVCILAQLLSDADLSSQILGKCFRKLEDTMKRLVAVVLNCGRLNRFQVQDSVSHALVLLGQCSVLKKSTVSLLFGELSRFADELQHASEVCLVDRWGSLSRAWLDLDLLSPPQFR